MEKEYKWRADEEILNHALLWASALIGSQSRTIRMQSSYYDTDDGLLRQNETSLRLRKENEKVICCMKLRNTSTAEGMRAHEEYECEASSIEEGIQLLPSFGAPSTICSLAQDATLRVQCTIDFSRVAILLQRGNTVCELALDKGIMRHNYNAQGFCEIELEFIAGDEAVFHQIAIEISEHLKLIPEPQSKLARAFSL